MFSFWDIATYLAFLTSACAAVALALWLATSQRAQGPAISAAAAALFCQKDNR